METERGKQDTGLGELIVKVSKGLQCAMAQDGLLTLAIVGNALGTPLVTPHADRKVLVS